jgi:2-dehydro-3-deoxyphosphogluconate aldolase/(4S)-4-hydroxy-2-oxoglutarate aldolase
MATETSTLFAGRPVMAILRNMTPERSVTLAERAWDVGIDLVEVPIQTAAAAASLAAVVEAGAHRGKTVGSGTVVTEEQVKASLDAGVGFTVAPGTDEGVIELSRELQLPHLPGVATPSDIQRAVRAGCSVVKAFPATVLGTAWFKAMQGPFPDVSFVATGGIDASNAADYLAAGALTVAVGSALADDTQLDELARLISGAVQGS